MNLNFNDFQKQDLKFDINKLKEAYKQVLSIKGFTGVTGVSNFGAISLTQIPGDPESIKGNKARGVFWTKPDSSGKEARSCLLYTSPSPRDSFRSRMPSSA